MKRYNLFYKLKGWNDFHNQKESEEQKEKIRKFEEEIQKLKKELEEKVKEM